MGSLNTKGTNCMSPFMHNKLLFQYMEIQFYYYYLLHLLKSTVKNHVLLF